MAAGIANTVAKAPDHEEFIRANCPTAIPVQAVSQLSECPGLSEFTVNPDAECQRCHDWARPRFAVIVIDAFSQEPAELISARERSGIHRRGFELSRRACTCAARATSRPCLRPSRRSSSRPSALRRRMSSICVRSRWSPRRPRSCAPSSASRTLMVPKPIASPSFIICARPTRAARRSTVIGRRVCESVTGARRGVPQRRARGTEARSHLRPAYCAAKTRDTSRRVHRVEAAFNRLLIYRGNALHSGDITAAHDAQRGSTAGPSDDQRLRFPG